MPLNYIGKRNTDIPPDAHLVVLVARNEELRLPYLLSYYRSIGFGPFLIVDNASTDGTGEFLRSQHDVYLFHSEGSFGTPPGAGLRWKHALLDRFCDDHWVLVADSDEILVWPHGDGANIRTLTKRLDQHGARAVFALLLDMYADKPFGEIGYVAGQPFLDYTPYFDRGPYEPYAADFCPFVEIWGGVRERLFKKHADDKIHPPTVSKLPLLRWSKGQRFVLAQHALVAPTPVAPMRAALLHFKMFDDLPERCENELRRREYFAQGREYRILGEAIKCSVNRCFFDPEVSVRYLGADQLLELELMVDLDTTEPTYTQPLTENRPQADA